MQIRSDTVHYVRQHWNELKEYLLLSPTESNDQRSYCYRMRQSGTYGTSIEILAMSEILKLNFEIYAEDASINSDNYITSKAPTVISKTSHQVSIKLLITGNLESGHYELLEDATRKEQRHNTNDGSISSTNTNNKKPSRTQRNPRRDKNPPQKEMVKPSTDNARSNQASEEDVSIRSSSPENKQQSKFRSPRTGRKLQKSQSTNKEPQSKDTKKTTTTETKDGKQTRVKWSIEEYKEIALCHYYTIEKTGTANLKDTYTLWKQRNPNPTHTLTANTLATQRRFILNNKKLSQTELDEVMRRTKNLLTNERGEQDNSSKESEAEEDLNTNKVNNNENVHDTDTINTESPLILYQEDDRELKTMLDEVNKKIQDDENTPEHMQKQPLRKLNDNPKLRDQIRLGNKVIEEIISKQPEAYQSITKLNKLIYATAETIQDKITPPVKATTSKKKPWSEDPPWKNRIQSQIMEMRRDLSHLKESQQPNLKDKMMQRKKDLYKKYKIKNQKEHTKTVEQLKQKVTAKTCRAKRYTERSAQYQQNKMFAENTSRFYNSIMEKNYTAKTTPPKHEIETFWREIWEQDTTHNATASWIQQEYDKTANIDRMKWENITEDELRAAISNAANWKAPGVDGITNFWLKKLTSSHGKLTSAFNDMINNKQDIPAWLTKGRTFLIPKNEHTEQAKNFRPITCLNNIYKLLTKLIAERLYHHLAENNIFPAEQKGCAKNTYGCKDHLLTSKMIQKDCKERKKNMSIAWIDYRKAFDKVPHTWIIEALNIYRVPSILLSFINKTMNAWNTDLHMKTEAKSDSNNTNNITIENIKIRSGIYQGDSLSPLLFCVALFPLSSILNNSETGYQCKNEREKISHLLYVDDLKLISKSDEELAKQLVIVKEFSDDINMEFGLDKCAKATFLKGRLQAKENIKIDDSTTIRALEQTDVYKYLGIDEHDGIQHKKMKTKLKKEYYRRIRAILKTELNAKNKMTAINSLALPVIQYSLEIIK